MEPNDTFSIDDRGRIYTTAPVDRASLDPKLLGVIITTVRFQIGSHQK